ncbi:hypothetical protein ACOME3_002733 [Neoechinorhynchus agilis]
MEAGRTVEQCLRDFSTPEILESESPHFCTNCWAHNEQTIRMVIDKCPRILILHLKRFKCVQEEEKFTYTKVCAKVPLSIEIDVNNARYRLRCFIVHCGANHNTGHFITVIRKDITEPQEPAESSVTKTYNDYKWLILDDASVKDVNGNVFEEFYGVDEVEEENATAEKTEDALLPEPFDLSNGVAGVNPPVNPADQESKRRVLTGYILFYELIYQNPVAPESKENCGSAKK